MQVLMLAGVVVAALAFSAILIRRAQRHGGTLDRHGLDGLQRIYLAERPTPPIPAGEGPEEAGVTAVPLVGERKGPEGR